MVAPPEFTTPEEFAAHMGWSARRIRQIAREHGACRIVGNRMVLTKEDIDVIMEAARPKPTKPKEMRESPASVTLEDYELKKLLDRLEALETPPSRKKRKLR